MARPKKEYDQRTVELIKDLAKIQCSLEEIAAVSKVSISSLTRHFEQTIDEGRQEGKEALRRLMWQTAFSGEKGAVLMQIWLSKQMLGYRDRVDNTAETRDEAEIVYNTRWEQSQNKNPSIISTTSRAITGPRDEQEVQSSPVGETEREDDIRDQ